ncbi:MAG: hypothetical protein J6Q17_05010, partial [Clostridia bacterium]|nr:hypothetical protein [Clostridia bacterium]
VGPHEALRLPMLYLLTWKTTGDPHWRERYLAYRDEAVRRTLDFVPLTGPSYAALQTQYSLRLVWDLDGDEDTRALCLEEMRKLAGPYEKKAAEQARSLMTPEGAEWLRIPYTEWKKSKFRYAGCYGGMGYFVPEPSDFREQLSYYPLRAVGEGIAIAALCPGHALSPDSTDMLCRMAAFVDYGRHATCAPIALLEGYWRGRAIVCSQYEETNAPRL